uniref:Uncharacterized protein n=1 Tax=Arundo donax TaxID=35708 RepID=A0A0A8ZRH7_ARUDO
MQAKGPNDSITNLQLSTTIKTMVLKNRTFSLFRHQHPQGQFLWY